MLIINLLGKTKLHIDKLKSNIINKNSSKPPMFFSHTASTSSIYHSSHPYLEDVLPVDVRIVRITPIYFSHEVRPFGRGPTTRSDSGTKTITMIFNHVSDSSWDDPPSRAIHLHFSMACRLKDATSIANASTTSRPPTTTRQHRGRGQNKLRKFRCMRDAAAPHGVVKVKGGGLTRKKGGEAPEKCDKCVKMMVRSVKMWFLLGVESVQKIDGFSSR